MTPRFEGVRHPTTGPIVISAVEPNYVSYAGSSLGHVAGGVLLAVLAATYLVLAAVEVGPRYLNSRNQVLSLVFTAVAMIALVIFGWRQLATVMRDLDFTVNRIGWEWAIRSANEPFMFFDRPGWGIGPDPYCGFEYAATPDLVVDDPGGSGHGYVERLGGNWYWICAA